MKNAAASMSKLDAQSHLEQTERERAAAERARQGDPKPHKGPRLPEIVRMTP